MKRIILLITLLSCLFVDADAQFTRYLVKLKNKGNNPYTLANPSAFLSQRSIERRTRYNIPLDSTDLPVTPSYISQIAAIANVTILNISKWLNQVSIQTSDANAITSINNLSFVQSVSNLAARKTNVTDRYFEENMETQYSSTARVENVTADYYDYGAGSFNEIHLHNGEFLHNIGMRGQDLRIAMLDAGFYNYTTLKVFDSVNTNGQVLGTWDFVTRNSSVIEDHSHGMACFSTIAANIPGQFVGTAPAADFYLFRTEDAATEYPIEEHNWVCGAERADSSGTDIISSSLGYTSFDDPSLSHSYSDLDGNTTMAAIGADLAAKKGILVVIAAGNEGNKAWKYIMTPADADSVLTVGAVNVSGIKGAFSSFGPTADGRVKPDVMSVGAPGIIASTGNGITAGPGTSYAAPKMAGLATCLWQAFPEVNNMRIIDVLRKSSSAAGNPTDSIGYGIPDMKKAFSILLKEFVSSTISIENCNATIGWTSKDISAMKYEVERKLDNESNYIKIGELQPQAGTILATQNYSYQNNLAGINAGSVSYRIKQIADTSTSGYTEIYIDTVTAIYAGCPNTPAITAIKVTAAPNPPVDDEITLIVETPGAIASLIINVYDNAGRLLQQQKESKNAGRSFYSIPSAKLSKGKYIITVHDGSKRIATTEIVKL